MALSHCLHIGDLIALDFELWMEMAHISIICDLTTYIQWVK